MKLERISVEWVHVINARCWNVLTSKRVSRRKGQGVGIQGAWTWTSCCPWALNSTGSAFVEHLNVAHCATYPEVVKGSCGKSLTGYIFWQCFNHARLLKIINMNTQIHIILDNTFISSKEILYQIIRDAEKVFHSCDPNQLQRPLLNICRLYWI